ncbi:MAG: hypothetical protein G01um101477_198 [Candidatus Doudnabacteria bacterium Gr01-1014_77]|uniref:Periplasmic immunogenic protein n=1 Tax=Candidatus Doudnabacteria bacterium Gr01-1014_77 TaxID=2017133 RepID=A0A554JCM5_9BACT|nr:MAG: hypothetical protein G01um101477_198 [Candidatus Doudnabacteria bacterium Gr01-1014_77]
MQFIPKWLVQTIAATVATLLVVLTVSQLYTVKSKFREIDDKHIINISAEGKVTVKPDQAIINAGVQTDGATAIDAQNANTNLANKMIAFVKGQGVEDKDVSTSGYNLYPKYDYSKGDGHITGYSTNQTVTVKVNDLEKVGKILDGLTKNGANQINGVNYTFQDPDNFREQAREAALKNAREKAENLARAAGVRLGKLISFSENAGGVVPMPYYADKAYSGMGGGGSAVPSVEPGVQDITAQISVSYEIY